MWTKWLRDNGRWSLWHRETPLPDATVCTLVFAENEFSEKVSADVPDFDFMCSDCLNERAAQTFVILGTEGQLLIRVSPARH